MIQCVGARPLLQDCTGSDRSIISSLKPNANRESRHSWKPQHRSKWAQSRLAALRQPGSGEPAPDPSRQATPASPNATFIQGAAKALLRARELSRKPPFGRRWSPWLMLRSAPGAAKRRKQTLQNCKLWLPFTTSQTQCWHQPSGSSRRRSFPKPVIRGIAQHDPTGQCPWYGTNAIFHISCSGDCFHKRQN